MNLKRVPYVTIVIPTYNQGEYLPACIDHCLFQTYSHIELIIVDGGSTDGTKQYLDSLENRIVRQSFSPVVRMDGNGNIIREKRLSYNQNRSLIILSFDEDIGATRTYNEGLKRATGTYCTYVVGDDFPYPHMIEELVSVLEETGADFAYSDMNLMDDSGCIIQQIRLPDYSFKGSLADWYHLGVSLLYKTELHNQVGLMDEHRYTAANDYDHYLRFAIHGARFVHVPKILYSIRYHGDNRKNGQHTDERHEILIEESKTCAFRARAFLEGKHIVRQPESISNVSLKEIVS